MQKVMCSMSTERVQLVLGEATSSGEEGEAQEQEELLRSERKLLEMLITKRAELKLWKEKEKEGSFLKQMSPDYPQGSLRNMLKSPSGEEDTTTPHPFWNMKDKAVGDHLQQKRSQLFWGLPSLHSKAAAWDSQASQSHKSASTLPGAFISPDHQEQQQQYTQRSFVPAGESSKNVRKMGSRYSERFFWKGPRRVKEDKHPSGDLGQDLERGPESPCTGSRNTSVKVLEDNEEESDSDWIRLQKYQSGNYLLRGREKQHVEKFLNLHLDRKLGEIKTGMIPVQARQSWRTASHAIPESDTHKKPRNLASWRCQKCHVNTSQELFFLDPCTQQMLEAHIKRFQPSLLGDW
ncbi:PREDICTED: spermatogenesis-associated protein 31E1-like [Propithecus coquereli]|uniref:spermatogenesis-associated protein 31E1-like n=1 Tax=Propithecus coquereli TaxID=379532 RepID=UPI00063F4435|nr:PREDICTED: spermatogenesis-associated protein 31E1-like [Propithecus coquereli]